MATLGIYQATVPDIIYKGGELYAALPIFNYISAARSVFTILDGIRDDRDLG